VELGDVRREGGAFGCCAEIKGRVHCFYQVDEQQQGGLLFPAFLFLEDSPGLVFLAGHDELEGDGDGVF